MTEQSSQVELVLVDQFVRSCERRIAHRRAWTFWARTSNALLALIAIAGAFSGGSAIADKTIAAAVLGIATAILSGLNVGLHPAALAALHQNASAGYGDVLRRLEQLLIDRENGDGKWRERLPEINREIKNVESLAPSVKPKPAEKRAARALINFLLGASPTPGDAEQTDT